MRPTIPERERTILAKEIQEKDRQLWLACCVQYYSALRPGQEVRLLRIRDINFQMGCITVRSDSAKGERTDTVDMPEQLLEEFVFQRIRPIQSGLVRVWHKRSARRETAGSEYAGQSLPEDQMNWGSRRDIRIIRGNTPERRSLRMPERVRGRFRPTQASER